MTSSEARPHRSLTRGAVVLFVGLGLLLTGIGVLPLNAATKSVTATAGGSCPKRNSTARTTGGAVLRCTQNGKKLTWSAVAPATTNAATKVTRAVSKAQTTPAGSWVNVTGNLAGLQSECGNLGLVFEVPNEDTIVVGIARKGLWSNVGGGSTWTQLGKGSDSVELNNRPNNLLFDPADPKTFWEVGSYGTGLYVTHDGGLSFRPVGDVAHLDEVSVDFSDPARRTLLVTTHEKAQPFVSADGGATWVEVSRGLPPDIGIVSNAKVLDSRNFLVGSQTQNGQPGVFRTSDAGATWSRVSSEGVWGQPLVATSDKALYWLLQYGRGLLRSVDGGLHWTKLISDGTFSDVTGSSLIELPDRRLAAVGRERVLLSSDRGVSWSPIGPPLPFRHFGFAYSVPRKAFYLTHPDCGTVVLNDAVMRYDFDYRSK